MTTLINRSWHRSSTARNLNDRTFAEQSTGVKTIRVGLLGCGTVGREIASQLTALDQRRAISDRARTKLTRILVRDSKRNRGLDPAKFATTIDEIFADKPDVIIEAIGGIDPARAFVEAALRRGISVITANKTLIAHEGDRLRAIAKRHRTALFCEACVGGAVPILAALKQLRGDRIRSIRGIINGTCNDVLSRMINERLTLHESLQLSIRAGLAEPDPSADISGRDSAEKLCVLAAAAGIGGVTPDQVETAGIESITLADIDAARSHGYVIKLVAELAKEGDGFRAHVGPALVSKRDPLARATGPQNVFVVDSELAGTLILQGAGAGPKPTASAILGDLQRAVAIESGTIESAPGTIVATDALRRRFARITGFRGRITPEEALSAFASHEVEIHHILVQADAIEVFTGPVHTAALAKACRSFEPNARLLIADVIA